MNQIILNNVVIVVVCLWFGLIKLRPHFKAIKVVNDQRFSDGMFNLKNSRAIDLGLSIVLTPQIRGFTPHLMISYQDRKAVIGLMKNLGYSSGTPLNLVYYYFAQQDLGRFRFMVKDGSKYNDLSVMSFRSNILRIIGFSCLFAAVGFLFSSLFQQG